MFAHIGDVETKTSDFAMTSLPKYQVLNDAKLLLSMQQVPKVVHPLSERFPSEGGSLFESISAVTVQFLTSDFRRRVHIEKKLADDESAVQKAASSCRNLPERTKEELNKIGCVVDPRLRKRMHTAKKELDLPLPKFGFAGKTLPDVQTQRSIDVIIGVRRDSDVADDTGDENPRSRSGVTESLLRSIALLDELTDNEFNHFCHKIKKFQQDIDAAVSRHHIAHSDS